MSLDGGKGWFRFYGRGFSFHYHPWENVAYGNQNNNKKHCRTIQNTKTDLTIQMFFFFETKTVNHKILRVLNVNSFKEGVYHIFPHPLLRKISYTLDVLNVLLGYEFR